ncbi:hypothetical protein WDU94_006355 [Cyamophila willieti]
MKKMKPLPQRPKPSRSDQPKANERKVKVIASWKIIMQGTPKNKPVHNENDLKQLYRHNQTKKKRLEKRTENQNPNRSQKARKGASKVEEKLKKAASPRSRSSSPVEKTPRKSPDKESSSVKGKSSRKKSPSPDKKSAKKKSSPKDEKKKSPKEEKKEEVKSSAGSLTGSSVKGAEFNPFKSNYHPIDDATWKHGEKVPYLALCRTLQEIEGISARLKDH